MRRLLFPGPPQSQEDGFLGAEAFVSLMAEHGLSQSELGRRLGLGQTTIWRWTKRGVPAARVGTVMAAIHAAPSQLADN